MFQGFPGPDADSASDFLTLHHDTLHDAELREDLGLSSVPAARTVRSPTRAASQQARHVREMWLHESSTNDELRRLLAVATVSTAAHVTTLELTIDWLQASSMTSLCRMVTSSDKLARLLSASQITMFECQDVGSAWELSTVTPGFQRVVSVRVPNSAPSSISATVLSARTRDVWTIDETDSIARYLLETGRASSSVGAVLAVPILDGSGQPVALLDCVRSFEVESFAFTEHDVSVFANVARVMEALVARFHQSTSALSRPLEAAQTIAASEAAFYGILDSLLQSAMCGGDKWQARVVDVLSQVPQLCNGLTNPRPTAVTLFLNDSLFPCSVRISQSAFDTDREAAFRLWAVDTATQVGKCVAVSSNVTQDGVGPRGILRRTALCRRPQVAYPASQHPDFDIASDGLAGILPDVGVLCIPLLLPSAAPSDTAVAAGVLAVLFPSAVHRDAESSLIAAGARLSKILASGLAARSLESLASSAVHLRSRLQKLFTDPGEGGSLVLSVPNSVSSVSDVLRWMVQTSVHAVGASAFSASIYCEVPSSLHESNEPRFEAVSDPLPVPTLLKKALSKSGRVVLSTFGSHSATQIAAEARRWGSIVNVASGTVGTVAVPFDGQWLVTQCLFSHTQQIPSTLTDDASLLTPVTRRIANTLSAYTLRQDEREANQRALDVAGSKSVFESVLEALPGLRHAASEGSTSLVAKCAQDLPRVFRCKSVLLFLPSDADGTLWSGHSRGISSPVSSSPPSSPRSPSPRHPPTSLSTVVSHLTAKIGSGIIGSCFASKAVLNMDEHRLHDAAGSLDPCLLPYHPSNLLCVPFPPPSKTSGVSSVSGCLVLLDRVGTGFSREDERAVESLGLHIASFLRQSTRHTSNRAGQAETQAMLADARLEVSRLSLALEAAEDELRRVRSLLEQERQDREDTDKRRKSFQEWLETSGPQRRRSILQAEPQASPATKIAGPPPPPKSPESRWKHLRVETEPGMSAMTGHRGARIPPPPPPRSPTVTLSRSPALRKRLESPVKGRKLFAETATSPVFSARNLRNAKPEPFRDSATSPSLHERWTQPRTTAVAVGNESLEDLNVSVGTQVVMSPLGVAVQTSPEHRQAASKILASVRDRRSRSPSPDSAEFASTQTPFRLDASSSRYPPMSPPSPRSGRLERFTTSVDHTSPATSPRSTLNISRSRQASVTPSRRPRRASVEDVLALTSLLQDTDTGTSQLFGKSMNQLRDLLEADRAVLYLADHSTGDVWTRVSESGADLRIAMHRGIVGHVAATGDTVITDDFLTDVHFDAEVDVLCGGHSKPLLCVPLKSKGAVIGVIQVIGKAEGGFNDDDAVLTKLMGSQIASVLQGKANFEAAMASHKQLASELSHVQQRARRDSLASVSLADQLTKLRTMLNLARLTSAVADTDSLIALVHKHVPTVIDVSACALYLVDHDNHTLVNVLAGHSDQGQALQVGQGVAGYVAHHGESAVWDASAPTVVADFHPTEASWLGIRPAFVLAVPVCDANHGVVGVLELARGFGGRGFASEDATLAADVAAHLSVACQRVQSGAEWKQRMASAMKEIASLQYQLRHAGDAVASVHSSLGSLWQAAQAALHQLSQLSLDRSTLFDEVAVVLRQMSNSQYSQLFITVSEQSPTGEGEADIQLFAQSGDRINVFPIEALTAGAAALSGESARVILHADEFWSLDKDRERQAVRGKHHVMLQPLVGQKGRVFGVLQLARRRVKDQNNAFTDEEAQLIALVAETVTGLVEASNTMTTLIDQRQELILAVQTYQDTMSGHQIFVDMSDQIFALAEAISTSQSPLQVAEVVQSKLAGLVDAESATLFLVDVDTKELWVPGGGLGANTTPSPSRSSPSRGVPSTVRFPVSKGLTGAAATSGKPVLSSEVYDDPRFFPAEKVSQKLRSVLCVPVFNTSKRVVAVLQLANKSDHAGFSEADVAIIEKAAAHLGVTLERSENIQTAQGRVKRATAELADIQHRATEVETLLVATSTEYTKAISAVQHVLKAINSSFAVTAVFDAIATQAASTAACEYVRMLFVDQSTQELVLYDPQNSRGQRALITKNSAGAAVLGRRTVSEDLRLDQLWLSDSEMFNRPPVLHVVSVPILTFDGVCAGVLQFGRAQSSPPFPLPHISLFEAFAGLMCVTMEASHSTTATAELLKSAEQQAEDALARCVQVEARLKQAREAETSHKALFPLAIMLSSLGSDVEVAQAVQRHAAGVLKVDSAVLFLLDSSGDLVSFPANDAASPSKRSSSPSRSQHQVRVPVAGSVLGRVVASGEAMLARKGDFSLTWSTAEVSQLRTRDVTSLLFTPVVDLTGGVQGVLAMFSYDARELTSEDKSAAAFLSGFISAILARIRAPHSNSPKKSDLLARARQLEAELAETRGALATTEASAKDVLTSSAQQDKRMKHKALRLLSVCQKQEKTIAAMLLVYHHCLSDRMFGITCVHIKDMLDAARVVYYSVRGDKEVAGRVSGDCVPTAISDPAPGAQDVIPSVSLSSQHPVAVAAQSGLPVNTPDSRDGSSPTAPGMFPQLGGVTGSIAVPICTRQGKAYVMGVLEVTCTPGKSFSADDERLVGSIAAQLAFALERRTSMRELETVATEGSKSSQEWKALLAQKAALIASLQQELSSRSTTDSFELKTRYEEQMRHVEKLEKRLMEAKSNESVLRDEHSQLVMERDAAVMALEATRQQLLGTASSLDQLRVEYERLIDRHDKLQDKMQQLVSLSASAANS